jgi:hypothetical protein
MPDDRFEARLQAGLRAYADARVRPADPFTVARSVVEAGRPRTPFSPAFGGRSGRVALVWLAALLALLVAASAAFVASGGLTTKRPITVATPGPTVSSAAQQLEASVWQLDIPASGITIASPQPFGWASQLELYGGTFSAWTGAGSGCDMLRGTYAATNSAVAFTVPSTVDGCPYLGTEQLRPRFAKAASYEITTSSSCANPSPAEPNPCVQLRLLDRTGAVLLVYVRVDTYYATFPGQGIPTIAPTP